MMHLVKMPQHVKAVLDVMRHIAAKIVSQEKHYRVEQCCTCAGALFRAGAKQRG